MSDYLFMGYAIFSPVVYASLAGRAAQNLIDTDEWHRRSFRVFLIGLLVVTGMWLRSKGGVFCPETGQ